MDDVDIRICQMLLMDSRTPYHVLAKNLGITVPAVHKRVRSLMDEGIIRSFNASIDIRSVGGRSVLLFGRSGLSDIDGAMEGLRSEGSSWLVLLSGDDKVHLFAFLREDDDQGRFTADITGILDLSEYSLMTHAIRPVSHNPLDVTTQALTPLEGRILAAMKDDSRKNCAEIAEELGITAKIARSKVESMRKGGKSVFSIAWSPDYAKDAIGLVHVTPGGGMTRKAAIDSIMNKHKAEVVMLSAFQEDDCIVCTVRGESMRQISDIGKKMADEIGSEDFKSYIIHRSHRLPCWKDKLLDSYKG
jgi:DNA-binding Lrp family transcriptional regulator